MTKQWLEGVRLLPFLQSEILNLLQIKPKDGTRSCPGDLESWNFTIYSNTWRGVGIRLPLETIR